MKRLRTILRSRAALLIVVTAMLASVIGLLPPTKAALAACAFRPTIRTYYSDATYTTVVGQRGYDCSCNDVFGGVTSPYLISTTLCCSVNTC